jgi:hypothetical protein
MMKYAPTTLLTAWAISVASLASAQSMSGLALGGDRSQLDSLGSRPIAAEAMGPRSVEKFRLSGGNDLSVTYHRASGKIVYIETDWGGETGGAFSDYEGFKYGKTTLGQIRAKLGSNGLTFKERPSVIVKPDGGIALFNSFEISGSDAIATFVTGVSSASVKSIKSTGANPDIGNVATLEAVIIGDKEYLETIWGGDKIAAPGYTSIEWPGIAGDPRPKPVAAPDVHKPDAADFPVRVIYKGKTAKPDFTGQNVRFRDYRTRIRQGIAEGPSFAGEFSVIQFGCGTGCSAVIVASNRTGQPFSFPRGGEDKMYLTLKYRLDSRLMVAQWGSYDAGKCFMEYLDFEDGSWRELGKREIGPLDACYNDIDQNDP